MSVGKAWLHTDFMFWLIHNVIRKFHLGLEMFMVYDRKKSDSKTFAVGKVTKECKQKRLIQVLELSLVFGLLWWMDLRDCQWTECNPFFYFSKFPNYVIFFLTFFLWETFHVSKRNLLCFKFLRYIPRGIWGNNVVTSLSSCFYSAWMYHMSWFLQQNHQAHYIYRKSVFSISIWNSEKSQKCGSSVWL